MMLETRGVTKFFGGLGAVKSVNLGVEEGTIHAVIGPNGAGKTTLFNMLTGEIPVTDGQIYFQHRDITGLRPFQIARAGIGRSFQQNRLFKGLSVLENVRLAVHARSRGRFNAFRHFRSFSQPIDEALAILEELQLTEIVTRKAGELSHGLQRTLEVAMALGAKPVLLLLDEPTSGMSPDETVKMIRLLKRLGKRLTMVIIEHNMNLVMSISSTITVLQQGLVIASGPPEEIKRNAEVNRAYLGGNLDVRD
jgi:branched-chain amino acid transport system ATP-binding protein